MGDCGDELLGGSLMALPAGFRPVIPCNRGHGIFPLLYIVIAMAVCADRCILMPQYIFFTMEALIIPFKYMCSKIIFFRQFFLFVALAASLDNILLLMVEVPIF